MDLKDLYRDVILDHNKRPRNFRKLDCADRTCEGFNPLCGDEIVVYLDLDDAGVDTAGGSVTLVANGAVTYTWAPAAGLDVTSGATVIA